MNGDDIIFAMTILGFDDYERPLKLYLQRYREVATRCPATAGCHHLTALVAGGGRERRQGRWSQATVIQPGALHPPQRFSEHFQLKPGRSQDRRQKVGCSARI